MNEWLFLLHSIIVISFIYLSFYMGKEAIIVFISSCWLFANFFISKEILLFGWQVTASDVYAIGGMFGLSLLQEYWGKSAASLAVFLSFILLLFATLVSMMHLSYIPSPQDVAHEHYSALLSGQTRILGASFVTFALVQQLEVRLFRTLQQSIVLPFLVRACMTAVIIQFVDTLLFSFLGLYGVVHSIIDVIAVSYTVKLVITCLTLPFIVLAQLLFPKKAFTYRQDLPTG
jgi:queuosine precursor transporter